MDHLEVIQLERKESLAFAYKKLMTVLQLMQDQGAEDQWIYLTSEDWVISCELSPNYPQVIECQFAADGFEIKMEIECISEYGERVYACTTWYEGSGKEVGPSVEGALIDELMNGKVCFYGTLIDGIQTLREEHHADVTAEMMEIVTKNLAA